MNQIEIPSYYYGKYSLRKSNQDKRKLQTIFFPNKWNFHYFINSLQNCQSFILACISQIDYSLIIKLLINLANNGKQIYLIIECKPHQKNDTIYQQVLCELLIDSGFKIKIVVNDTNTVYLPTNYCIIDGKLLITSSTNWTYDGFLKKHTWMLFDKVKKNVEEMIYAFEELWNDFKFVTFLEDDMIFLQKDVGEFPPVFSYNRLHNHNEQPYQNVQE